MTFKILVIDGIDNCGKTWVINRIKKLCPDVKTCKFPSDELVNSEIFRKMATNPTTENKEKWLKILYNEEFNTLSQFDSSDVVLIDRFYYSTLIYQGSGPVDSFSFEAVITRMYTKLMNNLNLHPKQIHHIIFKHPLTPRDDSEKNETKIMFDKKQDKLAHKLNSILKAIKEGHTHVISEFLGNTIIFEEAVLAQHAVDKTWASAEIIRKIQNERVKKIIAIFSL